MGAFQGIAQGLGGIGNDVAQARDKRLDDALKYIQTGLMVQEIQTKLRESQLKMKQQQMPQPYGIVGNMGVSADPNKPAGQQFTTQTLPGVPAQSKAPQTPQEILTAIQGALNRPLVEDEKLRALGIAPPTTAGKEPVADVREHVLMGIKDPLTNKTWTLSEHDSMPPNIRRMWDDTQSQLDKSEKQQEAKETRQEVRRFNAQTQAFYLAMQRGAVDEARKEAQNVRKTLSGVESAYLNDETRYKIMLSAYKDAASNPANIGSFDAALIAFHLGMTTGAVKGMRTGRDMRLLHVQARGLPEGVTVQLEHWINGSELSQDQRDNFLELAAEKMAISKKEMDQVKSTYDRVEDEYRGLVGDVTGGKTKFSKRKSAAPPPPGFTEDNGR